MNTDWALIPASIQAKTIRTSSCWNWCGATQSRGYGSITNGRGGTVLVHRRVYELTRGTIPAGLTIDHLCMNKTCVNPEHLEVVTRGENVRRALATVTHCKYGHQLSGDNLSVRHRKDGYTQRVCIACRREHSRQARKRQRTAA